MAEVQCFLCDKLSPDGELNLIASSRVPTSQKPVAKVLQHLANGIRIKLVFQPSASICTDCLRQLADYDHLMVDLLRFQKKLIGQLQTFVNKDFHLEDVVVEDPFLTTTEETQDENSEAEHGEPTEIIDIMKDESIDGVTTDAMDLLVEQGEQDEGHNDTDIESEEEDDSELETPTRRFHNKCGICDLVFKTKVEYQEHVNSVHNKVYSCHICGMTRRDEEYLELHMNLHEGKTENECRYCPKTFCRPVNTLRHMRKHWDKKKYQCEKCGLRFSQDNILYNHRLRHEAEENPIICSICNQSFKSRKTFSHHVHIHQENRPRHQCPLCVKSFTERYTLKMHLKRHSQVEEAATVAPANEVAEGRVGAEYEIMEDSLAKETCLVCSMTFESKANLDLHLKIEHDVLLE